MLKALSVTVLALYAAIFLFTFHDADEDLWGRLATGRLVMETKAAPHRDVFAYVPTKPLWVDHEWLSGVLFYGVHRLFDGGTGLLWLRATTGLIAVALACGVGRLRGASHGSVALVALAVSPLVIQGYNSVVRAQSFSFALFSLLLLLLHRQGRWLLALVPLFVLWANLHGGFVAGLCVVALLRPTVVGLPLLASLVNPYGLALWSYLAGALLMSRPEIVEWRAGILELHVQLGATFVVASLALGRELKPRDAGVVLGTLVATLLHLRFAPFLGLVAIAYLPRSIEAAFARLRAPGAVALMAVVQASVLLGGLIAWQSRVFDLAMRVPHHRYPVEAVDWLETTGAEGRLAVFFNWGEYALYRLHPGVLVSIDGRYETVYPEEIVSANWDFASGRDPRLVESYPPDYALYPARSGAARWLARSGGWRLVYEGPVAVLYETVEESIVIR